MTLCSEKDIHYRIEGNLSFKRKFKEKVQLKDVFILKLVI